MFTHATHRILIAWLIFALLLAQGLRVCMHTLDSSTQWTNSAASSHLESTFSSAFGGEKETAADVDVPLFSLLNIFAADPLIAIVTLFAALWIVLLTPQRILRLVWLHDIVFKLRFGHHFTPPLRAPPR